MRVRRKVTLTVDKLERLETKTLRRIEALQIRLVQVRQHKEKLQKLLAV